MILSFGLGVAIVLASRLGAPPGDRLAIALRATARWSFLLFWTASAGSALSALFGSRFKPLAQHARDFGLAFASAHLVHLGLVAWGYIIAAGPHQTAPMLFVIAVVWTYLLAFLSFNRLSAVLNPALLKILRTIGVEYISFAFLFDFARNPFETGVRHFVAYFPFLALATAGPLLRFAAAWKRRSDATSARPSLQRAV